MYEKIKVTHFENKCGLDKINTSWNSYLNSNRKAWIMLFTGLTCMKQANYMHTKTQIIICIWVLYLLWVQINSNTYIVWARCSFRGSGAYGGASMSKLMICPREPWGLCSLIGCVIYGLCYWPLGASTSPSIGWG